MVSHLTGALGDVVIAGGSVFPFLTLVGCLLAGLLYWMDLSITTTMTNVEKSWNKSLIRIRFLLLVWSAGMLSLTVGYWAYYYKVDGPVTRSDDIQVTWVIFAFQAITAGLFGYMLTIFYNSRELTGKVAVIFLWVFGFTMLAVAPLNSHGAVRMFGAFIFMFAILLSLVVLFINAEHPNGVFATIQGWFPMAIVIGATACYLVFFFLGSQNRAAGVATLPRWSTMLGFLLGGNVLLFVLGGFCILAVTTTTDYGNMIDLMMERRGVAHATYQTLKAEIVNSGNVNF